LYLLYSIDKVRRTVPGSHSGVETFGGGWALLIGGIVPGILQRTVIQLAVIGARMLDAGDLDEAEKTGQETVRLCVT
jgi:hypothetical protein